MKKKNVSALSLAAFLFCSFYGFLAVAEGCPSDLRSDFETVSPVALAEVENVEPSADLFFLLSQAFERVGFDETPPPLLIHRYHSVESLRLQIGRLAEEVQSLRSQGQPVPPDLRSRVMKLVLGINDALR